ncbi:MAG: polyribonucleotide nucleotidyltransferase [Planctomycetes bacterium]|nr:polyribonucleotide nucleotidyltransferase [Planctomycetota bacterium]
MTEKKTRRPAKTPTTAKKADPRAKETGKERAAVLEVTPAVPRGGSAKREWKHPGVVRVEREIAGRLLTLETGRMAKLSDGAVVARYGDTMVIATAQSGPEREELDFFPLTVEYRERSAAAGKFPGGFFKREGRPTTKEILGSRIIDRSIRPLFPEGFKREVQVLSHVLCTDQETEADVLAAVASVAALAVSSIPQTKTLGVVRLGHVDGRFVVNPSWSTIQSADNKLNLVVSAHHGGIVMVEAGADQLSEEVMLEGLELAHKVAREIAGMIEELAERVGKPKIEVVPPPRRADLDAAILAKFGAELKAAPVTGAAKGDRKTSKDAVKKKVMEAFPAPAGCSEKEAKSHNGYLGKVIEEIMDQGEREAILAGRRADGRDHVTIRPITIEVGVLPRVHGSVLFTRGETQALVIATLGTVDDQQTMDGIYPEPARRFLLHYNFPPYSVGEVKRLGSPGRREIGHGALAERAIQGVLPPEAEFPYTIRITSEILESNGSSSMATVCGGTLALMDAGVPLRQPVAGVAMGLVKEGDEIAILSDILGSEDHCGDMDFKVAGTGKGITALQMDIKCDGLTREIMQRALSQAKDGRMHVLREMLKVIRKPRESISPNAPRLYQLKIPTEKIGLVIGPSGKNIRGMQDEFQVKINIEDDGTVTVAGQNSEKVETCVQKIRDMTAEVQVGGVYKGRVTAVKEFGAFVEILPGQEGLCHVSELSDTFIRSVTDVVRVGDELEVKVIGIDDFGKIKVSRRALLAGGGDRPPRGDRGDRGPRERAPRQDAAGFPPEGEPVLEEPTEPVAGADEEAAVEDPFARPSGPDRGPRGRDHGGRGRGGFGGRGGYRGDRDRGDRPPREGGFGGGRGPRPGGGRRFDR